MTCSYARARVTDGSALRSSSSVSGWQSSPEGYFTGNDETRAMLARVEERTDPSADARPSVEPATLARPWAREIFPAGKVVSRVEAST